MTVETGPRIRRAGETYEHGVYSVGVSENADGSGWSLVFSAADEYTAQDARLGQDTHALSTADGATTYAGVRSCALTSDHLDLALMPDAAADLGLPERLRL